MLDRIRTAQREESGFTLIELLVVVIIIGILAAIAIPVFLNQRESAWRSSVESDIRNAATQFETVYTQEGAYPDCGTAIDSTNSPYDLQVNSTATGVEVTVSDGVTLNCTNNGQTYTITGQHTNLTETVQYDSSTGGMGDWS